MKVVVAMAVAWTLLATTLAAQRIVFVSDLNGRYGTSDYSDRVSAAVHRIVELDPELVVSLGDMVAGQRRPHLDDADLTRMWNAFDATVWSPLARAGIPFVPTPGNHDASAFKGFEKEREHYQKFFLDRQPDADLIEGSEWPWGFGIKIGRVLVLSIEATTPGKLAEESVEWLQRTLTERGKVPGEKRILATHLPAWSFTEGRESEILDDPRLHSLLEQHDISAVFSGHHHGYFAGRDGSGRLFVSSGALGGNVRRLVNSKERQRFSFVVLDLCGDEWAVSSRRAPDFVEPVLPSTMPDEIAGRFGILKKVSRQGLGCKSPN